MRVSINKLRWVLAGGAAGLVLLLLLLVGYGRYRAVREWKKRLDKMGIHIERETDGYTLSQSLQGHTVFTLHAAKAIQHKDGKLTLHDVIVTLYGKHAERFDRIYGAEFEYDDKSGVARAVGEVHMDIRAPESMAKKGAATSPVPQKPAPNAPNIEADPRDIHVRTSGLVFVRKLGVAATDQQVEFRYAGLECTAKGAEFNSGESTVHLLSDVHLAGDLRGKPMDLRASRADLDRDDNSVALANPLITSEGRRAHAANALVHLRKDGSMETAQAAGGVVLEQASRKLTAGRLEANLNGYSLPQKARLLGGVSIDDSDPARPLHGTAAEANGTFNAAGAPVEWIAMGSPRLQMASRNASGEVFNRSLHGDRISAQFRSGAKKGSSEIAEVRVTGSAAATAESPSGSPGPAKSGERKNVQVAADDLRALFAPSQSKTPELKQVFGEGHTLLQQDAPRGEQQISRGDHLEIMLALGGKSAPQVASAVQSGHVELQSRSASKPGAPVPEPVVAKADRSAYDAGSGKLLLTGSAQFTQGGLSMSSVSVAMDSRTGDSDAQGNVLATVADARKYGEATHVRSDTAHLQRGTQSVEFHGSDMRPVRLWQGASQVEAATLLLDGKRKTLAARPGTTKGTVHAVFATENNRTTKAPDGSTGVTDIYAGRMDYDDAARAATFDGDVHLNGTTGQVQAQHAVAFLTSAPAASASAPKSTESSLSPFGGSLQRAVIWGDVHLNQPGRIARGERVVYSSADASFVLTGTPGKLPQVVDAERGSITGTALMFRTGDNTVIVTGGAPHARPGSEQGGRVRLELGAKQ